MKKWVSVILQQKTSACVVFTAYTCVLMAVGFFRGEKSVPLMLLVSLLAAALVFAVLQWLCLSEDVFHKMRYGRRILLLAALGTVELVGFNWAFGWMPAARPAAWALFLALFLAGLAISTLLFELVFKAQGKKYDGLLEGYRKRARK